MSWKISGLVWELDLTHSQQSILLAMADHAEHDGSQVFPSIALIAWKTGYSKRQVKRVIGELRELGILILVKEANRYRPREYRIDVSAGKQKAPFRGDIVSPLDVEKDIRGDIAESARDDSAESARGDIAVSPRTTKKDHEPSDGLWNQVLRAIGFTYYPQQMNLRSSAYSQYWLPTVYGGLIDDAHVIMCSTVEQRDWLRDRGKAIAEKTLRAVIGIRSGVRFEVDE